MAVQGIQSVEIGARVLMAAARYPRGAALKQLAVDTQLSASQTHRYLTSWVRTGLMSQDPESGSYCLAEGTLKLGLAALRSVDAVERAAACLSRLVDETNHTGMLTVWSEAGPVCVRWLRGSVLAGTDAGLGSVFPILGSAVGRLFAAHLPPALSEGLVAAELKRRGEPHGKTAVREALANVSNEVKDHGYALARGHFVNRIDAIAAPVWDWQGQLVAAIGLILPDDEWQMHSDRYERAVLEAAKAASITFD